jgi:hypothetical protein
MLPRQHVHHKVPPTEGRPLSRKTKHDASKTLDEWTKKQCDTPRALQAGYRKPMQQPLSETSHTHRDFFGFVALPSLRRTPSSTNKKCYNYIERGHVPRQCTIPLKCHRNHTLAESRRTTLEDKSTM